MNAQAQYSQPKEVEDIVAAVQELLGKDVKLSVGRPDYSREVGTMDNLFITTLCFVEGSGRFVRYIRISNLLDSAGGIPVSYVTRYYTDYVDDKGQSKTDVTETTLRSRTYLHDLALATITDPSFRVTKRDVALLPKEIVEFLNEGFVPA